MRVHLKISLEQYAKEFNTILLFNFITKCISSWLLKSNRVYAYGRKDAKDARDDQCA